MRAVRILAVASGYPTHLDLGCLIMDDGAVCDIRLPAKCQVQVASELIWVPVGAIIIIGEKVNVFVILIVVLTQRAVQDYLLV
jgi:hypothetical protein